MELDEMIVDVGLRYDALNVNADDGVWDVDSDRKTMWENTDINPFDPSQRRATKRNQSSAPDWVYHFQWVIIWLSAMAMLLFSRDHCL